MSFINTQSFKLAAAAATQTAAIPESNVLGATGLPRAVLAAMFRRDGLFGRDSDLSHHEQAVLQSRMPRISGLARLSVPSALNSRLEAVAAYADALVEGRNADLQRSRLVGEGLTTEAITEIGIVVGNVRTVFGTFSIKMPAGKISTPANSAYAHAA